MEALWPSASSRLVVDRGILIGAFFRVSKLPAPIDEEISNGILETTHRNSYRAGKQAVRKIQLPVADAEVEPVPAAGGGFKPEPMLDRLSDIVKTFSDQFDNISGPTLPGPQADHRGHTR